MKTPRVQTAWLLKRPVVAIWLFVLAAIFFGLTYIVTRENRIRQRHLSTRWFQRGANELKVGNAAASIPDFRTALMYAPENSEYLFRLGQALARAGHKREAEAYFLSLWNDQPSDGAVNLELARLATASGRLPDALRYYHGAIYGFWPSHPDDNSRAARLELIQFLLERKAFTEAQSELIALQGQLPANSGAQVQVANLMMKAGDYANAFKTFRQALRLNRKNLAALAGAGEAAFHQEQYASAQRYLAKAVAEHSQDSASLQMLKMAELIQQSNPFEPHLSQAVRDRRALSAFARAGARLQQCAQARNELLENPPSNSQLQPLYARWLDLKPSMSMNALSKNPDPIDAAMELVFEIEQKTNQLCGNSAEADSALLAIAKEREELNK